MILGCGMSNIGAKLYEEGYFYITNVDFSATVIDYMKNKHQMFEEMDCKWPNYFKTKTQMFDSNCKNRRSYGHH